MVLALAPFDQTATERVPGDAEFKKRPWMDLVPAEVEHLAFLNYTAVKQVSSDYLPKGIVLFLVGQDVSVGPEDVVYLGTLTLPNAGKDSTIGEVIKPTPEAFTKISDKLRLLEPVGVYANERIYRVIDKVELARPQLVPGYLALISGHVVFTAGDEAALRWLKLILDTANSGRDSLFSNVNLRAATTLAGDADTGFSLIRFPGVISQAETTVYGLSTSSNNILLKVVHSFKDNVVARSRIDDVKRAYPGWDSYRVADNFVVASRVQAVDALPGLLNMILATP